MLCRYNNIMYLASSSPIMIHAAQYSFVRFNTCAIKTHGYRGDDANDLGAKATTISRF